MLLSGNLIKDTFTDDAYNNMTDVYALGVHTKLPPLLEENIYLTLEKPVTNAGSTSLYNNVGDASMTTFAEPANSLTLVMNAYGVTQASYGDGIDINYAEMIDTKMDDGRPHTGSVYNPTTSPNYKLCRLQIGNNRYNLYNVSDTPNATATATDKKGCVLRFVMEK